MFLNSLGGDLSFGWRVFSRQPLRTAIALFSLSLAIGANTAIFSVLNAVLLRPLPFPDADRLVLVVDRGADGRQTSPTIPEVLDVRARSRTLDAVTFYDTRDFQVDGGDEPLRVLGARVAPGFLSLLGGQPVRGRLLDEQDSTPGSPAVIVLSDGLWRRNFGADSNIVGRVLVIDGEPRTVAGVLAPDFSAGFLSAEPPDIYVPFPFTPGYVLRSGEFSSVRRVTALGRLAPGASEEIAAAELATIGAALAVEHPALYSVAGRPAAFAFDAEPLRESVAAGSRASLWILFGAVGLVLLIGCVNAAQFLLSNAIDREAEVALRTALGATRGRLLAQFLSETALLVFAAAGLGTLQAVWLISVLRSVLPPMRMVGPLDLDVAALLFAVTVASTTTLLCGVVPALQFSRVRLRSGLGPAGRTRGRQTLVAVQVALSVVLIVQAILLVRTLQALQESQSGFSADGVTAMRMRGMAAGARLGQTYAQYLERIAATPGIAAVAIASSPLPGRAGTPYTIAGGTSEAQATARSQQVASYQIVSPGYFSALRIPLREGRTFSPADTAEAAPVAIINQELARRHWPGANSIGRHINAGAGPRESTMTIVGVVGNVRTMVPGVASEDVPQIYVSYLQQPEPNATLLARPEAGNLSLDAVKRAIWSVEPRQAVFGVRPLDQLVSQSIRSERFVTVVIGSFAGLALAMSMSGVFGVVSYLTSRRQREVAVRRAIGAQRADVVWLLFGQTFRWTLAGLAIGLGAALLASRVLRATVPGLADLEPATLVVAGGGYLVVAAAAMVLPALRALQINPAKALRAE